MLYSRTLFIHSIYTSLHLLNPASHSIPLLVPSPLATTSLFSPPVTLFHRQIHLCHILDSTFHMAQSVKNLPALQEIRVRSLGWEDPLEKEMVTHSSILAWKISWTQEPGGL